jgi:hypothetical protein
MVRRPQSKRKAKAAGATAIRRLSAAEERQAFDRAARRYLGMSGRAFLRKWRTGAFKDPDADPAVRHVAMLAPVGC